MSYCNWGFISQEQVVLASLSASLPSQEDFRAELVSQVWGDISTFALLASASAITFWFVRKLAG